MPLYKTLKFGIWPKYITSQSATLATGPMPEASDFDPGPVGSYGPLARLASGFLGLTVFFFCAPSGEHWPHLLTGT